MEAARSTYRAVYDYVEDEILSGRLKSGDQLPAERDFSHQLGVSRSAVREGIRALQFLGVLTSSVGQSGGTRVSSLQTDALTRLLRMHVALADFPVDDVTELRVALERSTATMAASTASPERLAQLGALLASMEEGDSRERFNELDTQFHVCIAGASHNTILTDLTVAVRESLRAPIMDAEREMEGWTEFHDALHHQHQAIFNAIKAQDSKGAAEQMEHHIRFAYTILSAYLAKRSH